MLTKTTTVDDRKLHIISAIRNRIIECKSGKRTFFKEKGNSRQTFLQHR